jgi:alpha,alpha-trehalase
MRIGERQRRWFSLTHRRYMQAAFCTWYSTGGEIADLLVQLPLSDLNATGTYTAGEAGG